MTQETAHPLNTPAKSSPDDGVERLKADYRMFGGLLFTLGLCATNGSFAEIVTLSGNPTVKTGVPLALLIANVVQCFIGLVCIAVGFVAIVMDKGSKRAVTFTMVVIHFAWLPFLVRLTRIGFGIVSDPESNQFIPSVYNPTSAHVKFIGSMSFLANIAYAVGFVGSMTFMTFSMRAVQSGRNRPLHFYRGRAKIYNGFLILAGFTQLAVGSFIINTYSNGPLDKGPIRAGLYGPIHFPEISVTVGCVQIVTGAIGIIRSFRQSSSQGDSMFFQALCFFMYITMTSLQILSQVAYAPANTGAALAATVGCFDVGIVLMPAFLDWKMNRVPSAPESDDNSSLEMSDVKNEKITGGNGDNSKDERSGHEKFV